jgi:hypothetical protein
MMRKSATAFTTNFRVKKRHFHYKYAKKKKLKLYFLRVTKYTRYTGSHI